jgi:hypothetical protein
LFGRQQLLGGRARRRRLYFMPTHLPKGLDRFYKNKTAVKEEIDLRKPPSVVHSQIKV